jgi:hypothetical protein
MNIKIERVSASEIHVIDPQTEGTWRIISPHPISKDGALMAIADTIRDKNIQPAKGSTLTVEYQIRVAEEGEACHPVFDDILARIEQLMSSSRDQESGDLPKTSPK